MEDPKDPISDFYQLTPVKGKGFGIDSGMEIITKMNVPARGEIKNENIDIHPLKKPKIETDAKPKVEADIKIKTKPIEEFNRSIEIITNMNVPANNGQIKNEKIEPKIEMDIKPKIEADFKAKIEPIDDINRGMEIIGNMNIRSQASIMSDFCDEEKLFKYDVQVIGDFKLKINRTPTNTPRTLTSIQTVQRISRRASMMEPLIHHWHAA